MINLFTTETKMKFAEHLGAHITPEWRKQYINYEVCIDLSTHSANVHWKRSQWIRIIHHAYSILFKFCSYSLKKFIYSKSFVTFMNVVLKFIIIKCKKIVILRTQRLHCSPNWKCVFINVVWCFVQMHCYSFVDSHKLEFDFVMLHILSPL